MLVNVHSGSKVKDCVETALNHLKSALEVDGTPVAGEESRKASITLRAKDKAISKVISVVEIVKREFGPTKLSQTTEISYYQPNASAVARAEEGVQKATKARQTDKIPAISITLSLL